MGIAKRWAWIVVIVLVAGGLSGCGRGGSSDTQSPGDGQSATSGVAVGSAATSTAGAPSTTAKPGTTKVPAPAVITPKGAKLATVTAPPSATLARIKYRATRDGQLYNVVIRPYGTGPTRAGHGTVVVVIDSSTPQKSYKDSLDLKGTNALLELGPKVLGGVTVGGRYSGVVRLLKQGDYLVLELVSAKAK